MADLAPLFIGICAVVMHEDLECL